MKTQLLGVFQQPVKRDLENRVTSLLKARLEEASHEIVDKVLESFNIDAYMNIKKAVTEG